jgi:hypothetical protein
MNVKTDMGWDTGLVQVPVYVPVYIYVYMYV